MNREQEVISVSPEQVNISVLNRIEKIRSKLADLLGQDAVLKMSSTDFVIRNIDEYFLLKAQRDKLLNQAIQKASGSMTPPVYTKS